MSSDIVHYRATDPHRVKRSLDAYQERVTEFNELVKQFELDYLDGEHELAVMGNGDVLFASHLLGHWSKEGKWSHMVGSVNAELIAEIPPGWHYYVNDEEVRPYRNAQDTDSKAARAALDDLNAKSPGGLRAWISDAFGVDLHGFGFEPVGDTYYILRGQTWITRDWDGNEHFEKVKTSTYWIDKEAADEVAEESEDA